MDKAFKVMCWAGWGATAVLIILWPLLTLPAGVFSKSYFTFWVVLSLVWGLLATAVGIILPFWESKEAIADIIKGMCCGGPATDSIGKDLPTGAMQSFPA